MVEGHSVHRVVRAHLKKLIGKRFTARSPNGRFTNGAQSIDGQLYKRVEVIGKNIFAFFGESGSHVVHVHFGMSGRWGIFPCSNAPAVTPTTRLTLEGHGLISHLSAMTVEYGGMEMYLKKRSKLGEDPLSDHPNVDKLWHRISKSKKSISRLLMDQSFFAGVGNIYRAEILFAAKMHPNTPGIDMDKDDFYSIWNASMELMKVGRETGRIMSVNEADARQLGDAHRRRFVYGHTHCFLCRGPVSKWNESSRTVWACMNCQINKGKARLSLVDATLPVPILTPVRPQQSEASRALLTVGNHPDSKVRPKDSHDVTFFTGIGVSGGLVTSMKLPQLRQQLRQWGLPVSGKKQVTGIQC
jgi:formamidopyrimidine-DNA glycosylase